MNAYVLAGDPAWIAQSIGSYYHLVERIIVSFDRSRRSWAGHPLSVDDALARIAAADPEDKVRHLPGDHVDPDRYAMHLETEQRQGALDAASEGANWVLQLDTDEVMRTQSAFVDQLRVADSRAADALEYPSINLYARTASGRFLETCGRWWTTQAAYPGPLVVRAGTKLSFARQAEGIATHRVDVKPWNTDPAHPGDARVHAVVHPRDAVLHFSWVRTEAQMTEKSVVSGHASGRDWDKILQRWRWSAQHPRLEVLRTPFIGRRFGRFRLADFPEFAHTEP